MGNSELILAHICIGFSTFLAALLMKYAKADEPNKMMGYRTNRSMKSQEAWTFANNYSGNTMQWAALFALTLQIFSYFVFEPLTSVIIAASAISVALLIVVVLTELKLRQKFDENGKPKSSMIDDRY